MAQVQRRQFLVAAGALLAAPRIRSQPRAIRTIGYLSPRSADVDAHLLAAFRKGLTEAGYIEGRNLNIEYRWAEGQYDRLPSLAADLASRQVAVIITVGGPQPARAMRAVTQSIPIVFLTGSDPVQDGLVGSFNRPGGNTTGIHVFTSSLGPKRLELLRELVPKGGVIGFLVNPTSQIAKIQLIEVHDAARAMGQQIYVVNASTKLEIDEAFAALAQRKASGLLMSADLFYQVQREQLVALASRYAIPTMYEWREFVMAGGLISYSTARSDAHRQSGAYVGRILNGAKPGELPVIRSTEFELVLNLKTAKQLGLAIPRDFLARVDEAIQ
jgi:putative ABC transport system substrate-binding protein